MRAEQPAPVGLRIVADQREMSVLPTAVPGRTLPVLTHPEPGQRMRISGRVDAAGVAEVRLALREAVDNGIGELLVEVPTLELGDATGLGALLGAHRRALRAGRRLVLIDPSPAVVRVLTMTRLARVLRTRVTAASA